MHLLNLVAIIIESKEYSHHLLSRYKIIISTCQQFKCFTTEIFSRMIYFCFCMHG